MGESAFREMTTDGDVADAAADAVRWGFPRSIPIHEREMSFWFRYGPRVVFWYQPAPGTSDLWIHLAVHPQYRKAWGQRRWVIVAEALAEILGAERLRFFPVEDQTEEVPGYLTRLGWEQEAYGLSRALGVVPDGR